MAYKLIQITKEQDEKLTKNIKNIIIRTKPELNIVPLSRKFLLDIVLEQFINDYGMKK